MFATSITCLNYAWYKDYPQTSFHFFNDNSEWMQMDKFGHFLTSYTIGNFGIKSMQWAGLKRKPAIWLGGSLGSVFLLTVEILDGFSKEWGFSTGDFIANTTGSALVISQALLWDEQKIIIKWSYHSTDYPKYRHDLLGKNWRENWLKDYNGHSYWLSGNIYSLFSLNNNFPKWLNIAFGMGANGMLGAKDNPIEYKEYIRKRTYYLSLDIYLSKIKTNNKIIKTIFNTINFIKVPSPTLEYNKIDKFKFIPIFY
jgi:hypothetical protein